MGAENTSAQSAPVENTEATQFTKVEEQAIEQGWRPKEDFDGEEHKWVDAGEFLRRGELFGKIDSQKREISETKRTIEALKQHYLKVQETEYKRAMADLKKQKKEALIENDVETVLDVDEQLEALREEQQKQAMASAQEHAAPREPHPEFVAWTNKNSWYESNKPMRVFADALGNELQGEGKSPSEVLRLVGEEVRKKFPEKFYNPKRDQAGAVEGVSTGKQNSSSKVELTELETTIMKKLVGQGVLTKEQYMKDIKESRERS